MAAVPGSPPVGSRGPGGAASHHPSLAWGAVGLALVGTLLIIGLPQMRGTGAPAATAPTLGSSAVDLSAMTPREAADRLFNRIFAAAERGETNEANQFLPMGIAAYEQVTPLDDDGVFHLSLLYRLAGDLPAALAAAETILETNPDHLLALSAAAEAAREMGNDALARERHQHFVDVIERPQREPLVEYEVHGTMLSQMEADARAFLAAGGDDR